jgi:hypothetical protein
MIKMNWNIIWRWMHIMSAVPIIVYFAAISNFDYRWSASTDELIANYFIWLLMWTGIAKWRYPRYKKWRNRKNERQKHLMLHNHFNPVSREIKSWKKKHGS